MAGSISLAGAQQFDVLGRLLGGAKVYWIQAGTTSTPQNAYYDTGLATPLPNPYTLEADARIPFHYLADGQIKVRIVDGNGVTRFEQDNILVIGPSSGEGGGDGVDPTTIIATGDIKARYGTGSLTGFVRLNGRTIGSATSGATERANADTQALFGFLWQTDPNLAVSTGRGVSANADWVANKTIALPEGRNRALAGLGDMGGSASTLFDGVTFTSGNATTLGSLVGAARRTLNATQIPAHTHPNTLTDPGHFHNFPFNYLGMTNPGSGFSGGSNNNLSILSIRMDTAFTGMTITNAANTGGGNAFDSVSPLLLVTYYIKL